MSVQLLDKTRKINKLLHNNHSHRVEFNDICEVLSGILESNILVISQKGKILGAASYSGIDKIGELITADTGGFVDNMLNERLLGVLSTKENVNLLTLGFSGGSERKAAPYCAAEYSFRKAKCKINFRKWKGGKACSERSVYFGRDGWYCDSKGFYGD